MANPLYSMMNQNQPNDFAKRFQQFKKSFNGNPQEMIQQMLNSGKITQDQYNKAVQIAQQFSKMI